MKVLVVGGAGYIGSVVTALLVEHGHQVTVLDDLSTGHRDAVHPSARFVHASVFDAARVLGAVPAGNERAKHGSAGYDGVLHFAARSLVGESVSEPQRYWQNNVVGSLALLDAMRDAGVAGLVFSSTAATYGAPEAMPITEDTPAVPTNPYGASKLAVDQMLTSYAEAYGLRAVSLRYFNVAGAYGVIRERHDPETHLIPNLLRVAAGEVPEARLFGTDYPTTDGTAVRDYLHVVDLADAHLRALDLVSAGGSGAGLHRIINLGSGHGFTVREMIEATRRVTGHPIPAREEPRRAGDPPSLVASNTRARDELGWAPTRDLRSMVSDAWAAWPAVAGQQTRAEQETGGRQA